MESRSRTEPGTFSTNYYLLEKLPTLAEWKEHLSIYRFIPILVDTGMGVYVFVAPCVTEAGE